MTEDGAHADRAALAFESAPQASALDRCMPLALGRVQPVALPESSRPPDAGQRIAAGVSRIGFTPLGLYCVLVVQAVLSLRLIWSNTAFLDEATYLFVGHVELAHLGTGSSVPDYPTYLSGAPVIYPPLAALANQLGGLAVARLLSLLFMLGATALLWDMTSRLADRRAGFFAAAIFVALGPTQYLGAFATYDAMSLFLMTAAAWCVVAASGHTDSTLLVLGGAALLALSNATKYATGIFDPVVIALAALCVADRSGVKPALARAGFLAVSSVGLLAGLLGLGGPLYVTGILSTTLSRASAGNSAATVLSLSARWIGPVVVLAACCVLLTVLSRQGRYQVAIVSVLASAGLLVPLNQARIHTTTSLSKHVDFGAWFAAAAAGIAVAWLTRAVKWRELQLLASAIVLGAIAVVGSHGRTQAANFYQVWPNSTEVVAKLQSLTLTHPGNYLAEDFDVPAYYLENRIRWHQWFNTWYFSYTVPGTDIQLTGPTAYRAAIADHYFTLIILDFGDTAPMDKNITQYIRESGQYHVISEARYWDKFGTGQFTIWAYKPSAKATGGSLWPRPDR